MMLDLGKYTDTVLLAYAVSITLLLILAAVTWVQHRRAKRLLNAEETRNDP